MAARSAGVTGRSAGPSPVASLAPTTCPPRTPPPARATLKARGQWSRPPVGVQLRRSAELAHHDHERLVEQPALVQVVQEGGEAAVEGRDQADALLRADVAVVEPGDEILMRVPAAVGDGDERDAPLDQPAGQQEALAEGPAAVAVAEVGRLRFEVEGGLRPGRGRQAIGLLEVGVVGGPRRRLDRPAAAVERLQVGPPPFEAEAVEAGVIVQVANPEAGLRRVAADRERPATGRAGSRARPGRRRPARPRGAAARPRPRGGGPPPTRGRDTPGPVSADSPSEGNGCRGCARPAATSPSGQPPADRADWRARASAPRRGHPGSPSRCCRTARGPRPGHPASGRKSPGGSDRRRARRGCTISPASGRATRRPEPRPRPGRQAQGRQAPEAEDIAPDDPVAAPDAE